MSVLEIILLSVAGAGLVAYIIISVIQMKKKKNKKNIEQDDE